MKLFFTLLKKSFAILSKFSFFKSLFESFALLKLIFTLKGVISIFSSIFSFIGFRIINLAAVLNKLVKRDITVFMLVISILRFFKKFSGVGKFGSILTYVLLILELVAGVTMLTTLLEYSGSYISEFLDNSKIYKNYITPAVGPVFEVLSDWWNRLNFYIIWVYRKIRSIFFGDLLGDLLPEPKTDFLSDSNTKNFYESASDIPTSNSDTSFWYEYKWYIMGAGVVVVGILVGCVYFLGSGTNASVAEGANVIESANAANQGSIWVSIKSTTVSSYNFIYNHTVGYFYPAQVVEVPVDSSGNVVNNVVLQAQTGHISPVASDPDITLDRDHFFPKPDAVDLSQSLTPRASQSVIDMGSGSTDKWAGQAPVSPIATPKAGSSALPIEGVRTGAVVGGSSVVRQELVVKFNSKKIKGKKFLGSNIFIKNFSTTPARSKYLIKDSNLTPKLDCEVYEKNISGVLTVDLIHWFVNKFWNKVMTNLSDTGYIIFLFKVEYEDGKFFTFDQVHRAIPKDKHLVLENLETVFKKKDKKLYKESPLRRMICQYWIKENNTDLPLELLTTLKEIKKTKNPKKNLDSSYKKFSVLNIPLDQNYTSWGEVLINKENSFFIIQDKIEQDKTYVINHNVAQKFTEVEVKITNKNKTTSTKFIDRPSKHKDCFIRLVNNYEFYIKNGANVLQCIRFKMDYLKTLKKEKKITNKFIALDMETMVINGKHVPYCICYFDGKEKYSFYLSDYSNYSEMMQDVLLSLFKTKYSGYAIYVHNLSHFDGIFLLNALTAIDKDIKIDPILRNGNMINIKVKYGPKKKYNISFRDSFLILPMSLKELAKQFKVNQLKTIFPYNFLNDRFNSNLDLDYVGNLPDVSFFGDSQNAAINYAEYLQEFNVSDNWSLKNETIRYCLNDCVSLYEVISKFNEEIFNKFKLNIHKKFTLPSLTFSIFRSNYLKPLEELGFAIPLIDGKIYSDIKKSYTGGSTDMFVPFNPEGTKVYGNDVNSLYPTNMRKNIFMPVISKKKNYIIYFEGDISLVDEDAFGFFNVEVQTTIELAHPILQVKHNTGQGIRTISPLGNWKGMYFSEELKNASKYGYKYKIFSGYLFEKFDIFAGFIKDIYKIKESYNNSKNSPWYTIAKLLLNALYGKFGMNPDYEEHAIIDNSEIEKYSCKFKVTTMVPLNNKLLICYTNKENLHSRSNQSSGDIKKGENGKTNFNKNVSISISSAITAYARVYMSKWKNIDGLIIYYTDTDSLYTNKPLDPKYMGSKLGMFKLENVFDRAVFVAPKVYGGITESGEEITKVKGFKNTISFYDLEKLLYKNSSLELNQEKWFKSIKEGSILIKDQSYTLSTTENKRELIYENGKLVGTKPFVLSLKDQEEDSELDD